MSEATWMRALCGFAGGRGWHVLLTAKKPASSRAPEQRVLDRVVVLRPRDQYRLADAPILGGDVEEAAKTVFEELRRKESRAA